MSCVVEIGLQKYQKCISEVVSRLELIKRIEGKACTTGIDEFDCEIGYLNLRKILEQIAFASIVANEDLYSMAYADFASHWNARRMVRDLEKINPDFYPRPLALTSVRRISAQNKHYHFDLLADGFLTKDELVELYKLCGGMLHAKNPFQATRTNVGRFTVAQWRARIEKLLEYHYVHLVDANKRWLLKVQGPVVQVVQGETL